MNVNLHRSKIKLARKADLDDAGGVVIRAADEAEAVGQQRQGEH